MLGHTLGWNVGESNGTSDRNTAKERDRSLLSCPLTSLWHSWGTCTHFTSWQDWKKLLSFSACHVCSRRETSLVLIRTPAKSWGNCRSVCLSFTFFFPSLHSFSNSGGRNKTNGTIQTWTYVWESFRCVLQLTATSTVWTSYWWTEVSLRYRAEVRGHRLQVWLVNMDQVDAATAPYGTKSIFIFYISDCQS